MANINFNCSDELKDQLKAIADYYNISQTAAIKMLIVNEFNDKRLDKIPGKDQLKAEFGGINSK